MRQGRSSRGPGTNAVVPEHPKEAILWYRDAIRATAIEYGLIDTHLFAHIDDIVEPKTPTVSLATLKLEELEQVYRRLPKSAQTLDLTPHPELVAATTPHEPVSA